MSENVSGLGPTTIKIKKNKGITHALKDMVDKLVEQKKAELTDGKITAQEWNAVLDKLVELQENRKAAGKASIFSGGTDKTQAGWHNSFVVHPDQEITFTAEETAEIYEAMGVVIKGGSAPVDPNDPADQPVDQEEPPEGTQTPAGQLPEGVTETAGKDENGRDCMIWKDQDGREIKRIYNNDDAETKYSVTVEYGENGKKTKEIETQMGNDKTDIIRYYNEDGKISKVEDYADDGTTINSTKTYEYNEDGSYKETISGADEKPDKVIEYDGSEEPRPVKEIYYEDDGTTVKKAYTYEYKDDKLSRTITFVDGGKLYRVEEYDSSGDKIKHTVYAEDGETAVHIVENGLVKMTHIATTDADGNTIEHKYDFDENGVCTRSDLAVKLRQQIEPASLNKNTIKLLKQLNPENIIKVLTSYQILTGKTLQQAIEDEWDLSNSKDTMRALVQDALDERLRQLGLEPSEVDINDPEQLAEIAKRDNIKSRGY